MNPELLHPDIQDFIKQNLNSDTTRLILKGSPFDKVSMPEIVDQIISKQKCLKKLPTWFHTENIYYPNKLNIEQTSSETTAQYKSNLISGNSLIDITGGFGVDCFYFSKKIKKITHCEVNTDLSKIAAHNFKQLGVDNIKTLAFSGLDYLEKQHQKYDWIYIDPSRRSDVKGKVFLLTDCIPNVPKNIELLFKRSDNILIKNSPILDITSAINELKFVKEIHVIATQNEVKELLFLLEKGYHGNIQIKTINIQKEKHQTFNFNFEYLVTPSFSEPKKYIYEPNSAILKSGGFNQVSEQLAIAKLQQHSHLYTSDELVEFPGRRFIIEAVIPYDKKKLKKLIPSKKANITTRNFPETVAQIRKKTGIKDGGAIYLFFTTDIHNKHLVIICKKV